MYLSIQDKGMVVVSGCSHSGIINILDHAKASYSDGDNIYAIYGGLHISPFGDWDQKREDLIEKLSTYGIRQIACNHCTGVKAVERMVAKRMPILKGTGRHGSVSDLYIGNGDSVEWSTACATNDNGVK
jgi:7,8-dihydropterin-6-yl-methyl-4-(beta-D-ribofuranosyl)aminobenzene 5'-phosphate synthase